jgi:hypothetical protein
MTDESTERIDRTIQALVGVVGTAFGLLWLLYTFAWSTVIGPHHQGWEWWTTVLRRLAGPNLAAMLVGVLITLTGLGILYTSFLPWRKSKKFFLSLLAFLVALMALVAILS